MKRKVLPLFLAAALLLQTGWGSQALAETLSEENWSTDSAIENSDTSSEEFDFEEENPGKTQNPEIQENPEGSDEKIENPEEQVPDDQKAEESESESGEEVSFDDLSAESGNSPESDTGENPVQGLTAQSKNMELVLNFPNENPLPEGAVLEFYAEEQLETLYGSEEESWNYEDFKESLKKQWLEVLKEKYQDVLEAFDEEIFSDDETEDEEVYPDENAVLDAIQYFCPFEFLVKDAKGNVLALPEGTEVYANFSDPEAVETARTNQSSYNLGTLKDGNFTLLEKNEILLNEEERKLAASLDIHESGLYMFVQADENWNPYPEAMFLNSAAVPMLASAIGSPISSVSGWKQLSTSATISSEYLAIRRYEGSTSYQLRGSKDADWKRATTVGTVSTYDTWQPVTAGKGSDSQSHGARYNKVIYDWQTGSWYDLIIFIAAYKGEKNETAGGMVYPSIGFQTDGRLRLSFSHAGDMVLRYLIVKTGTQTAAKKKVRLAVWDIDSCQYVAIGAKNGSIDHKYYYNGSLLSAFENKTIAGKSGLSYVEAPASESADRDKENCAIWDLNADGFYLALGYYNNDEVSDIRTGTIYNYYKNGKTLTHEQTLYGTTTFTISMLELMSTPYNPPELEAPVKSVSNDNKKYQTANELSSPTDSYWYRVDFHVPDTANAAYYFQNLTFTDKLRAGVDYDNSVEVYQAETNKKVTSWFNMQTSGDVIKLTAKSDKLSASDFYGYTYRFLMKVKMDPTEISPVVQNDTQVYIVKNTAQISAKRGGVTLSIPQTNEVTTTAKAVMYGSITITKQITASDITYAHGNPVFRFVVSGTDIQGRKHTYEDFVEFQKGAFTVQGDKAVMSVTFDGVPMGTYEISEKKTLRYAFESLRAAAGKVTINGQKVSATLNAQNQTASVVFSNKKTNFSGYSHSDVVRNTIPVKH